LLVAGHETTVNLIGNSGRITAGGHDISTVDGQLVVQRVLGYLPPDSASIQISPPGNSWTTWRCSKGSTTGGARRRRVEEMLELVGLAETAARKLRG
jgi:hypothetical protein